MTKLNADQRAKLTKAFPSIAPAPSPAPVAAPAPAPIAAPVQQAPQATAKPVRTVGNIYSAVQAQAIFNPGQPTPPDPSGTPNGANGGIGNNPANQTIKSAPAKQVDMGTVGNLQPDPKGWGRTTNG